MYRASTEAAPLAFQRVDVDAYVAQNPGLPESQTRAAAVAHNSAIDLALGEGEFFGAFEVLDPAVPPTPYDPGPAGPLVDSLTIELKSKDVATVLDAELVRDRLARLVAVAPDHPFATNWRVFHARAFPYFDNVPEWPEFV